MELAGDSTERLQIVTIKYLSFQLKKLERKREK